MKVDSFEATRMIISCMTIDPNNYPVPIERKTVYSIPIKLIEMKF
jgi:hypothetical protein